MFPSLLASRPVWTDTAATFSGGGFLWKISQIGCCFSLYQADEIRCLFRNLYIILLPGEGLVRRRFIAIFGTLSHPYGWPQSERDLFAFFFPKERKIRVSPGPYPASNSPPGCCVFIIQIPLTPPNKNRNYDAFCIVITVLFCVQMPKLGLFPLS